MNVLFSVFAVVNMVTRAHVVFGDQQQVMDHMLGFGGSIWLWFGEEVLLLVMGFICMLGFM